MESSAPHFQHISLHIIPSFSGLEAEGVIPHRERRLQFLHLYFVKLVEILNSLSTLEMHIGIKLDQEGSSASYFTLATTSNPVCCTPSVRDVSGQLGFLPCIARRGAKTILMYCSQDCCTTITAKSEFSVHPSSHELFFSWYTREKWSTTVLQKALARWFVVYLVSSTHQKINSA